LKNNNIGYGWKVVGNIDYMSIFYMQPSICHMWNQMVIYGMYQQILNVLKKHMANDNWLQLKSGKKHWLGVKFLYVAINLSCMKIVIDGVQWSHDVWVVY
jgi:hypothetical protein